MRRYSEKIIPEMNAAAVTIAENGLPIVLKPSPTEPRQGFIDRTLWEQVKDSFWMRQGSAPVELKAKPPVAEIVAAMRDGMGGFNENLNSVEIYTKYEELSAGGNTVGLWRYYTRKSQHKIGRPALVYYHGGGWNGGTVYAVENACRFIAEKADAVVFSVDYSLAPEKPYPNAVKDCYAAVCHVYAHAAEYGIDRDRIAVGGDSAGGNLAAVTALMARDKQYPHIALQMLLYPAVLRGDTLPADYAWSVDMLGMADEQKKALFPLTQLGKPEPAETDFNYQLYCHNHEDPCDPYISPAMAAAHTDLPRALLLSGEFDGLRIQTEYYGKLLKNAGVPVRTVRYRGLSHAIVDMLGILPQAEDICLEMANAMLEM